MKRESAKRKTIAIKTNLMKIIIMRGLPGSGKSTYAKALLAQFPDAYKRINRAGRLAHRR